MVNRMPKSFSESSLQHYLTENYFNDERDKAEQAAREYLDFVHRLSSIPMAHLGRIPVDER